MLYKGWSTRAHTHTLLLRVSQQFDKYAVLLWKSLSETEVMLMEEIIGLFIRIEKYKKSYAYMHY